MMISSAIIPQPLARLPWRLIFLVLGIAAIGILTLYSAAGGALNPWALKQGVTILGFLTVAIGMSWISQTTIKQVAFPFYGAVLIMLLCGGDKSSQKRDIVAAIAMAKEL